VEQVRSAGMSSRSSSTIKPTISFGNGGVMGSGALELCSDKVTDLRKVPYRRFPTFFIGGHHFSSVVVEVHQYGSPTTVMSRGNRVFPTVSTDLGPLTIDTSGFFLGWGHWRGNGDAGAVNLPFHVPERHLQSTGCTVCSNLALTQINKGETFPSTSIGN